MHRVGMCVFGMHRPGSYLRVAFWLHQPAAAYWGVLYLRFVVSQPRRRPASAWGVRAPAMVAAFFQNGLR